MYSKKLIICAGISAIMRQINTDNNLLVDLIINAAVWERDMYGDVQDCENKASACHYIVCNSFLF